MTRKPAPKLPVRKVTAKEVALRAGVSKWTVSRAFTDGASISPKTLERVMSAASELGWRPNLLARSLSKKRSGIIGVVVDEMHNPNLIPLLDEVTHQLQTHGCVALLLNISSSQRDEAILTLADQLQVDGLLFMGTLLSDEIIRLAKDIYQVPLVQIGRSSADPYIQVVTTDGYRAGREIADLLHAEGYQHFAYMKGPDTDSSQLLRYDGYRDRLVELGVDAASIALFDARHYQRDSGYRTFAQALQAGSPIDALFCENDILAIGAIEAMRAVTPARHVGIVGFDGIELAASPSFALTTCGQPFSRLVPDAIRRLTTPWDEEHNQFYPGELQLRQSHRRP